jgi:hypothetical protein
MIKNVYHSFIIIFLIIILVGCTQINYYPNEQQIGNIAWRALDPYTSSHNRKAWEIIEIKKVVGSEIIEQFKYREYYGCITPATQIFDSGIDANKIYWFVHMKPRKVTPLPPELITPATVDPLIVPDIVLANALFLIDPGNGQVLVRRLGCNVV